MSESAIAEAFQREGIASRKQTQSLTRRLVWSRDASHFRIVPGATHRAKSLEEVARILSLASREKIPVTFRSGGSSLSGQTLGHGIVIDTRSGFQSLLEISPQAIKAQPGVTLARLNAHLARNGRKVGPDPASMVASTLGGAVSNNSSGMTCGTKFNSYATIRAAKICFSDGALFDTSRPDADEELKRLKPELFAVLEEKRDEIRANKKLSKKLQELFTLKNTMGYSLNAFLDFDSPTEILLHLLVGSEGTLGFLGEVELETLELKKLRAAHLLLFANLEDASSKVPKLIDFSPAAIELMDSTSLSALKSESMLPAGLAEKLGESSAAVLVEFEANTDKELEKLAAGFKKAFAEQLVFADADGELRNQLWSMRKGLYAVVAKARPIGTTALLEDVAVPPTKLAEACKLLSEACVTFGYGTPVIFGHVRDGNIHFMISDNFSSSARVEKFKEFTNRMVEIVLGLGGNLKAEHGTGRAMAPFVEQQFGAELYEVMKQVKRAFDPHNIFNPGVIFPASATDYLENLKSVSEVSGVVDSCVECGYCESSCPSAGLTLTPRERIVAYRELSGQSSKAKGQLERELLYEADQTCAVDGMCAVNCPVSINTGSFVKELREERSGGLSSALADLTESNWKASVSLARAGIKAAQSVPVLAAPISKALASALPKGSFPTWNRYVRSNGLLRGRLKSSPSEYVYLPSCMNEIFGEHELPKFLALAKATGNPLTIPQTAGEFCCGTPFSSKGQARAADSRAQKNKELFASHSGKKWVIDGSSCHQTLLQQFPGEVMELTEFVAQKMIDIPVKHQVERMVLHPTCSGENTGANRAMEAIAQKIAKEVIVPADWRCCGFAGDRGLLVPELTANATSLESAEVADLDAVFVSNNQPCQIGMSQGTDRPYVSILSAWLRAVS